MEGRGGEGSLGSKEPIESGCGLDKSGCGLDKSGCGLDKSGNVLGKLIKRTSLVKVLDPSTIMSIVSAQVNTSYGPIPTSYEDSDF